MGTRSEQLATQFEAAVKDLADTIEKCPDSTWGARAGDEGWTFAGLAQHVSGQFPLEMEYVTAWAEGKTPPSYTWDDINGKNDSRAAQNQTISRADVLKELKTGAASTAAYIRGLSDDQLERKAKLPLANGAELTTQQVIESGILIDHVRGHLKGLRSAN
jgi:hypothetical protein